jgi:hypothetical protein
MPIRKIFYVVLSLSYFGLAAFFYLKPIAPAPWNIIFAIACVIIGGLRLYRALKFVDA